MGEIIYLVPGPEAVVIYCNGTSFHFSEACPEVQKAGSGGYLTLKDVALTRKYGRGLKPCKRCISPILGEKIIQSFDSSLYK